jgi:hypothetical protein
MFIVSVSFFLQPCLNTGQIPGGLNPEGGCMESIIKIMFFLEF